MPSIAQFHPFTPRAVGWQEADILRNHSRPHVRALQTYAQVLGWQCSMEYLTDACWPRAYQQEGITWRFWPASLRWYKQGWHHVFRREWSLPALARFWLNPPDLTLFNMSGHGSRFTQVVARLLQGRGRPYIAMIGGYHVTATGRQLEYYQSASAIITHTRQLRDDLVAVPVLAGKQFGVLPLGVDTTSFYPRLGSRLEGDPVLLYVGRLVEIKGVHLAIQAARRISDQQPAVKLHLVGPQPDAAYLAALEEMVVQEWLEDQVIFHGPVPYQELSALYSAADLLLLPSRHEGFGMVVVESLACGTPVAALDTAGGPAEVITHGVDGILAAPDDYVEAVGNLIQDRHQLARMRSAAREKAVQAYSQEVTTRILQDIIEAALGQPG